MKSARRRPARTFSRRFSRRRGFAAAAGALATVLVLAACSFPFKPPTATTPDTVNPSIVASAPEELKEFYSQQLEWKDCENGFQCTTVRVPLDYSNPGAGEISLAAIRLASNGKKQGTLLVNPGGPGGSGVDFVKNAARTHFTSKLRSGFDVVGFDPRGVKRSAPVTCLSDSERDEMRQKVYRYESDAGLEAALADNKVIIDKCVEKTGPVLAQIDTVSAAKDLDVLRAVMNDAKLNYLGYSYGTFLGSTYASLFPDNVGRMVLDGAVDPSISNEELTAGQARAFEQAIRSYVADCQAGGACPLNGGVDKGVQEIRDLIRSVELNPQVANDGRLVTAPALVSGLITPLYDNAGWPALTQALDAGMSGDFSPMLRIADLAADREPNGTYSSNSGFAFNAINCLDYPMVTDTAGMRAEEARLKQDSPTLGYYFAYGGLNCKDWPYKNKRTPGPVEYKGAAPVVVIGTTGDPATPVEWAGSLRRQLGNASLLTWKGEGHTAYGRSNSCVADAVDGYFVDGKLPADGAKC